MDNSNELKQNLITLLNKDDLSFDYKELSNLEQIFLNSERFCKRKTGFKREDLETMLDFYLGEFYIHHVGGKWAIDDLKGSVSHGHWIVNYDPKGTGLWSFIPHFKREGMSKKRKFRVDISVYFKGLIKRINEELNE